MYFGGFENSQLADPDLQMGAGGRGAGGHPDPEIRGGGPSKKKTKSFPPLGLILV